jgi:hypothetical protein
MKGQATMNASTLTTGTTILEAGKTQPFHVSIIAMFAGLNFADPTGAMRETQTLAKLVTITDIPPNDRDKVVTKLTEVGDLIASDEFCEKLDLAGVAAKNVTIAVLSEAVAAVDGQPSGGNGHAADTFGFEAAAEAAAQKPKTQTDQESGVMD